MANELVEVKTQNAITAFMGKSESWRIFADKFSAKRQEAMIFDLYAYVNKNADTVAKMDINDFMGRVIECYSQGFTLQDGDAYIIPFKNKDGVNVATFVSGYKGVVRLAMQTGLFKYFDAVPVIRESIARFDHRRNIPIFNEDYIPTGKEQVIGYYGYSETKDGMIREIYHPNEYFVDFAKRKSPMNKKATDQKSLIGIWHDDFPAMCMKTIYKELGKLAPKVKNPTEQQTHFYTIVDMDEEVQATAAQDKLPPHIDADGVVHGELPLNEPPPQEYTDATFEPSEPQEIDENACVECGKHCESNVVQFSTRAYGKVLCYDCQKKYQKGNRT